MQCTASKMVGSYTLNSLKDGELCMQPIHSIHKIADSNASKMADSTVRTMQDFIAGQMVDYNIRRRVKMVNSSSSINIGLYRTKL